jgi:hypothetical protein
MAPNAIDQADAVDDSPVLICYDGSVGARNAITAAAALLVGRAAVILNVAPLALVAEAYAAAGSGAASVDRRVHGVRELVDGSLSHEVAEHARRPVLVVPPNELPLS